MAIKDLNTVGAKDAAQLDKVGRRDSILPERRGVRSAAYQPAADLRSARRGDVGGAEALMRTLGVVKEAANDFQQYSENKFAVDEQENMAAGYLDQATGAVREDLVAKSAGYRNAVTQGRTITEFGAATRDLSTRLNELLEKQDDPDIGVRRAEALKTMEEFYGSFAKDPDTGELRKSLQSPGAMRYLADAIGQHRSKTESAIVQRIEERFNGESLELYGKVLLTQALETGTVDLAKAQEVLSKTIPGETVQATTVNAISTVAQELRANGRSVEAAKLLDSFLGSVPKVLDPGVTNGALGTPGSTPSATPAAAVAPGKYLDPVPMGRITDSLGSARPGGRKHNGVDIAVPVGTPVKAGMGGTVLRTWNDTSNGGGLSMKVKYDDGTVVGFAHLDGFVAAEGARVNPGDVVARSGNTGNGKAHLHYTMTKDGKKIDPRTATAGAPSATGGEPPANPQFRLTPIEDDPLTAYEREGKVPPRTDLGKVTLGAEDLGKFREMRAQLGAQFRADFARAKKEDQDTNAAGLYLRLYGQGQPITPTDVAVALQKGEIEPGQAISLFSAARSEHDRALAAQDRVEAKQTAAERKADEDNSLAITGRFMRRILAGEKIPAIRSDLLKELPRMGNQRVAASVLNSVLGVAGDIERTVQGSQEVRDATAQFIGMEEAYLPKIAPRKAQEAQAIFNRMNAYYAAKLAEGGDATKAYTDAVGRYKPQLDALVAARAAGRANTGATR